MKWILYLNLFIVSEVFDLYANKSSAQVENSKYFPLSEIITNLSPITESVDNELLGNSKACSFITIQECEICHDEDDIKTNPNLPFWDSCSIEEISQNCHIFNNNSPYLTGDIEGEIANPFYGEVLPLTVTEDKRKTIEEIIEKNANPLSSIDTPPHNYQRRLVDKIFKFTRNEMASIISAEDLSLFNQNFKNTKIEFLSKNPICIEESNYYKIFKKNEKTIIQVCPNITRKSIKTKISFFINLFKNQKISPIKNFTLQAHKCFKDVSDQDVLNQKISLDYYEKNYHFLSDSVDRLAPISENIAQYCIDKIYKHPVNQENLSLINFWLQNNRFRERLNCPLLENICRN